MYSRLNGIYYLFTMDGYLQEEMYKEKDFRNKERAIAFAEQNEAAFIEIKYKDSGIEWSKVIYDPYLKGKC